MVRPPDPAKQDPPQLQKHVNIIIKSILEIKLLSIVIWFGIIHSDSFNLY